MITVPERYRRTERFGCSRSSKVIDFGTNRKRVCDFLLVRHSNLGPILHRFRDIAGFLRSRVTPPLFYLNFLGCSRCTRWPMLGSAGAEAFGRETIFEVFQPM